MAIQRDNPYHGFNFLVNLGDGVTETPTAGFQEVSNIGMEVTVAEYRRGNSKDNGPEKIPGLAKMNDVSLKRGAMGTLDFYRWLDDIRSGRLQAKRDITIQLQNEDHTQVVMTWNLLRTMLSKYVCSGLNGKGNDVAMEEITLVAEQVVMA
ncbi:MAG: hypothetical protein QOH66_1547 [Actinomycetota bacterium]|jgi:phage tail-like protein|nr:hypothetical protein [Actinomycetota bacterium]